LVLEKGGEHSIELQELILDKMVDQLRQQEKFADMEVKELRKIASEGINWEDAVETATSFMFPVVNSIKGIGESIRQSALKVPYLNKFATREMVEHYKQSFAAATNEIKKHTNDILSPIGILVDPIIGVVKGFGKMMNIFSKPIEYEKETARWQHETFKAIQGLPESFANEIGKITGILNEQLEHDRQIELERDREIDTPEKSWFEKILTPLLGFGAFILGGIYKSVILPFQIIGSLLSPLTEKLVKGVKGLVNFFKGLPVLSGVSENVQKFSTWVKGLVGTVKGMPLIKPIVEKVTSLFGKIKDFGNKFGFLGKIFKNGMRWLGWPITVVMGLIDFVKGFKSEQGNIIEKIYGGLKEAFLGLFELPIMAIGWITDKILGMFGVEIEGGIAKKIEDVIGFFFDTVGNFFGGILDLIKEWGSKIPFIGNIFEDSTETRMVKTHKTGAVNIEDIEMRKPVSGSGDISTLESQTNRNDETFLRYLDRMSSEMSNAVKQQTQTLRQTTEVFLVERIYQIMSKILVFFYIILHGG
jgi:hypothetical protein